MGKMSNGKIKATALNKIGINSKNTPPILRKIVEIVILMVIYIITARIGQLLSIPPGNVTPVWIPSGIMLAAVLLRGYWIWPGIFLGAFIGNTWAYFDVSTLQKIGLSVFSGSMNGTGDVLCAVVAAYLINKAKKTDWFFNKSSLMAKFIIWGAMLGPLISAIFGVSGLCVAKIVSWNDFLYTFATWLTGDGVGALIITPFLVVVISREYWDYPKNKLYEVIFFTFALIGITFLCTINQ